MANIFKIIYFLTTANRRLHWNHKKLKRYQSKRLHEVIKWAYETVPYYHNSFRKSGIDINSIRSAEDLNKLPLVTKDELKSLPVTDFISTKYNSKQLKEVRTSGSTGKPLKLFISPTEDAWRKAIYMRANIQCGQKPFDRWVVLTAPHHFGDTTRIQRKIGIYAQQCISLFESNEKKIQHIIQVNPQVLDGYSGALVMLAKEVKRREIKSIKPHLILGNAEVIDIKARKFLEDIFEAPYCDQFGCAEVDRSAWQCKERNGYHMDIDSVITQFIDENGDSVANGERGEITYTSLFNYAMPLIRYQIGDIGIPSGDGCSCSLSLPLMDIVEGRKDSFLVLPDNRVVSPFAINLEASGFKFFSSIDQYHIRQTALDKLEIYLKINNLKVSKELIALEFENYLKNSLKIDTNEVKLKTNFVDDIAFTNGGKLASISSTIRLN